MQTESFSLTHCYTPNPCSHFPLYYFYYFSHYCPSYSNTHPITLFRRALFCSRTPLVNTPNCSSSYPLRPRRLKAFGAEQDKQRTKPKSFFKTDCNRGKEGRFISLSYKEHGIGLVLGQKKKGKKRGEKEERKSEQRLPRLRLFLLFDITSSLLLLLLLLILLPLRPLLLLLLQTLASFHITPHLPRPPDLSTHTRDTIATQVYYRNLSPPPPSARHDAEETDELQQEEGQQGEPVPPGDAA